MAEMTRRAVLAGIGTLGIGVEHHAWAENSSVPEPEPEPEPELGLDDPESNLTAYVKLRGDLAGGLVYDIVRGDVYGLVSEEAPRPLFKLIGAQRSRYTRVSALEFLLETSYVGILLDWETEQPLKSWMNPYNDRLCEPPVTRYGPSAARLLTDGMAPVEDESGAPPRAIRPWFLLGDVVHLMDRIASPVARALQPDTDLMIFSGNARQLADPLATRVPCRLSFTAVEHWREWMHMQRPGSLWWHAAGAKLAGPGDYPQAFRAELQTLDPEFLEEDNP